MTPLEIQFELKKNITQVSIARELGVSEMSVSLVIRKRSISDRIMRAVSEKVEHDHRRVFPEYYVDGQPFYSGSWILNSEFFVNPILYLFSEKFWHPSYAQKSSLHFSVGAALAAHGFMLCG